MWECFLYILEMGEICKGDSSVGGRDFLKVFEIKEQRVVL